jgi:hypothetical protein
LHDVGEVLVLEAILLRREHPLRRHVHKEVIHEEFGNLLLQHFERD